VSGTAWARIWLAPLVAGHEEALIRVAPITHAGALYGLIVVERPGDHEAFTDEDERVLAELARQVGVALYNVRLDSALQSTLGELRRQSEELRASRARIVAAADAERRRIERDLHDGAQQRLVALSAKLRLARELAADDAAEARAVLDELGTDIELAIEELRELAHGIYPPLLVEGGLADALTAAATRAALPATVELHADGRYPLEIEAAVYFCCTEALQNAAKHAGADAQATVRVWEEAGGLLFEVADNGTGFDPGRSVRGAGFTNMADRLGAFGGTLGVESTPGAGTAVRGVIPLRSSPSEGRPGRTDRAGRPSHVG
jgi:signal transduction histidine kinase